MNKRLGIAICVLAFLTFSFPAWADFYVVPFCRGVGTEIKALPFEIKTPGFYYITRDLNATGTGITVSADNVTIDLMGFSLIGPGSGTNFGIYMNDRRNVEIRNGTIRNFGQHGIYEMAQQTAMGHRVLGVRTVGNGGSGILLYGSDYQIKDCTASNNGDDGIFAGRNSLVTRNTVAENKGNGIYGNGSNLVVENVAKNNKRNGICAVGGSTVIRNNSTGSTQDGITVAAGCTVINNTATFNSGNGISVGPGTYTGSTVKGNTSASNGQDGIAIGADALVIENIVYSNQNYGISFAHSCLVDRNVAVDNNKSGGPYTNLGPCVFCTVEVNHAP